SYKCINYYHFVKPRLPTRFYYQEILALKSKAPVVLDVGCCTGTDLRKLMFDGYPGNKLIGIDQSSHYIQVGYELFRDAGTCPIQFITEDVMSSQIRAGIVYTSSVIHLFSLEEVHTFLRHVATNVLEDGGLFVGTHVSGDETMTVRRRGRTKHFIGTEDFRAALIQHDFGDIQFSRMARQKDPDESQSFDTYWLSFRCRLN
ncbi:S-adenosyl-L-methionine-dependent methyltransferase, partial [Fennellomyces sp. T-0311]